MFAIQPNDYGHNEVDIL